MKKLVLCLLAAVCVFSANAQDSLSAGFIAGTLYSQTAYDISKLNNVFLISGSTVTEEKDRYFSSGVSLSWFPSFLNKKNNVNSLELLAVASKKEYSESFQSVLDPDFRFSQAIHGEQQTRAIVLMYNRHQKITPKVSMLLGVGMAYINLQKGFYSARNIINNPGNNRNESEVFAEMPAGNAGAVLLSAGIRYCPVRQICIGMSIHAGAFYTNYKGTQSVTFSNSNNGQQAPKVTSEAPYKASDFFANTNNLVFFIKYCVGK